KSEAVPEVRRQADLITSGITDRREQARAIFDWVSRNIRYFGIFLGNGGYIPRSAATVLVDKYGDCKDH
ncbi:transglutaminase domain-containing protein, partial [Klebsiella pneumoniae]|uniref:transglutaminase domain-containing protein n=1 Tax=Klebsiella pneumoniae TaxID=573 RepID=UPI0013D051E4